MVDVWSVVFSGVSAVISSGVGYIAFKLKQAESARQAEAAAMQEASEAERAGLVALLRERMMSNYYKYEERGAAPMYARENYDLMYQAYHKLGGNGLLTDMYERFMNIPLEKQS